MSESEQVEVLGKGNFLCLKRRESGWEYAERIGAEQGAAVILGITKNNDIIFVEQYRPPLYSNVIELPAGLADVPQGEGFEAIENAAKREFFEETGYEAEEMKYLIKGPSSPGLSNEMFTLFFAMNLTKKGHGGGDEQEGIIVHEVKLEKAEEWLTECLKKGLIIDPKVYLGLYFAGQIHNSGLYSNMK